MFIAAVAALALPILYGWANRPHSMFYVAGCFMFAVVARLEWTYCRIKHTFDELRLAVEETALTQLPQMPGPDGSRRGSAMSTETGSLLSASGDIGQATSGVPRWSASAHSSTSTLASVSEMPYTNVNHTPKVTGRLTLLDGVTESPDSTDGAGTVVVHEYMLVLPHACMLGGTALDQSSSRFWHCVPPASLPSANYEVCPPPPRVVTMHCSRFHATVPHYVWLTCPMHVSRRGRWDDRTIPDVDGRQAVRYAWARRDARRPDSGGQRTALVHGPRGEASRNECTP